MEGNMISPRTAIKIVMQHCTSRAGTTVPISAALGCVLAEDLKTSEPSPRFDNSAMDGFAIRSLDTRGASAREPARLAIVESVYAGEVSGHRLRNGEACRIMTGAPVPSGADAVAPKEMVKVRGDHIEIDREVAEELHIRRRGEEVGRGVVILRRGVTVDAGVTATVASLGRARVRVISRPAVSVVATGDETVPPGRRLRPGQIYDSNSHMLTAALRQMGIEPVRVRHVGDHPAALHNATAAALRAGDVVIVTGGVSVGDRDYLRDVLARQGIREVFWRVKQKPGKPLYFGTRGRRVVFGLPGNPASAFTCFYVYVYPALLRMAGHAVDGLPEERLPLAERVKPDAVRWRFLKARTIGGSRPVAEPLPRQASHMISSLVDTDRLIMVPPGRQEIAAGTEVSTWSLPRAGGGCR
jgi:molybdopterin molybdotransferase